MKLWSPLETHIFSLLNLQKEHTKTSMVVNSKFIKTISRLSSELSPSDGETKRVYQSQESNSYSSFFVQMCKEVCAKDKFTYTQIEKTQK